MLAADVYAEGLAPFGYGHPLWIPEPITSSILIGDVGYLLDGRFYPLFNVTRPATDPVNSDGVPDNFTVIPFDNDNPRTVHRVEKLIPSGSAVCSKSVRKLDISLDGAGGSASTGVGLAYRFACAEEKGALLILKDHATGEQLHPTNRKFIEYMAKNYPQWCKFASKKYGLSLEPEEIILVRGWVKTSEWAVASFIHGCSSHGLSFHADAGSFTNATFSVTASEERSAPVLHRIGPDPNVCAGACTQERSQCIFLSFFKLKRALPLVPMFKIVAGAEPKDDSQPPPPSSRNSPIRTEARSNVDLSYSVEAHPTHLRTWDPVEAVLDYILQNSNAKVAIASQMSLRGLVWPQDNDLGNTLAQNKPIILVDAMQGIVQTEVEELQFGLLPPPHQDSGGFNAEVATVDSKRSNNDKMLYHYPETTRPSLANKAAPTKSFNLAVHTASHTQTVGQGSMVQSTHVLPRAAKQTSQCHNWQTLGYSSEGQGFVVPQIIYIPPPSEPPFTPRASIIFYDATTRLWGIPLDKALLQDFSGLLDANTRPETTSNSSNFGIKILWPGHEMWTDRMHAVDAVAGKKRYMTKALLAHEVAKKIRDFHRDMSGVQSTDTNPSWWLNGIPLNQLVLGELRNVSEGSWQPVIIWRP